MTNNKRTVQYSVIILCMILAAVLFGCTGISNEDQENHNEEPLKLNIEAVKTDTGEEAFSISIEDFINSFNRYYKNDNNEKLLEPIDKWQMYDVAPTVHNDNVTTCYMFSEDPDIRSLPQLRIHADSIKSGIYQISVCYDFHSFSPETYELYSEMCYYTMRTMLPEHSNKEIKEYSDTVLDSIDESFSLDKSQAEHSYELTFKKGSVGIYPYYVAGDTAEIRIIPVI